MPILIDGYNIIGRGKAAGLSLQDESKEKRLLDLLARYRDRKGVRQEILVIFDGSQAAGSHVWTKFSHRGIQAEYAIGESADDALLRKVSRAAHPRQFTVITSDQRVQRQARLHGASVLSSDELLRAVALVLAPHGGEKPEALGAGEVEEWLRIFPEPEEDR